MMVNTDLIMQLIDSHTQMDIARNTGVPQPTISRIKRGAVPVGNLTVEVASRLTDYAIKVLKAEN